MLVRYNSIQEVVDRALEVGEDRTGNIHYGDEDWDQRLGFEGACNKASSGDFSMTAFATNALDKVQSMGLADQRRMRSEHVFAGGTRVDVPAYLAGSQRCMLRRTKQETSTRHVSIYSSVACSVGVSVYSMLKRGSTILALLECLQAMQVGVDLWLIDDSFGKTDGCFFQAVRIESQPLDLSTSSFAIAHPAFGRNITLTIANRLESASGRWPTIHTTDHTEYERRLRPILGMQANDLFIPPGHSNDAVIQTPEVWLEKSLRQVLAS